MFVVKQHAAVIILGCLGVSAGSVPHDLPAELRGYRGWKASEVKALSIPFSILCVALPAEELARRRAELTKTQGPHAEGYLRVYANPTARSAKTEATAFPAGSLFVKEKLADPYAKRVESVAFMIKRPAGARPQSGDWEFRYVPEPRNADYSGCIECHRTGASRDYVFTRLDEQGP